MRKIDKTMQAVKAAAILARFCDDRDTCKGCPFIDRQSGQCIYRDGVDPNEWPQYDTPIQYAME